MIQQASLSDVIRYAPPHVYRVEPALCWGGFGGLGARGLGWKAPDDEPSDPMAALGDLRAYFRADNDHTKDGSNKLTELENTAPGASVHLTAASAELGPTYEATGWNSAAPSFVFNAIDQYMSFDGLANLFSGDDTAYTIVAAVQAVSVTAGRWIWSLGSSSSDLPLDSVITTTTDGGGWNTRRRDDANSADVTLNGVGGIGTDRVILTLRHHGTTRTVLQDGVDALSAGSPAAMNVGACTFNRATLGALGRATYVLYADVRFGAFTMFLGDIGATNAASAASILATTWPA
jgi:hypothetical protein